MNTFPSRRRETKMLCVHSRSRLQIQQTLTYVCHWLIESLLFLPLVMLNSLRCLKGTQVSSQEKDRSIQAPGWATPEGILPLLFCLRKFITALKFQNNMAVLILQFFRGLQHCMLNAKEMNSITTAIICFLSSRAGFPAPVLMLSQQVMETGAQYGSDSLSHEGHLTVPSAVPLTWFITGSLDKTNVISRARSHLHLTASNSSSIWSHSLDNPHRSLNSV